MYKLLIASNNQNKVNEIKQILNGIDIKVVSLEDENLDIDPEENGRTFAENASIKAKAVYDLTKLPVLADDSGLIVELLDNKPGVYSKRYAGPKATDDDNNKKVVNEILNLNRINSKAKFICSIAFVDENGTETIFNGECSGIFLTVPKGKKGFGYDPYFLIEKYGKTMAQLGAEEKNNISHRGKAIKKFEKYIRGILK